MLLHVIHVVTAVVQKVKMFEFTWNNEKYITLYVPALIRNLQ
jgi:hypothetical protein